MLNVPRCPNSSIAPRALRRFSSTWLHATLADFTTELRQFPEIALDQLLNGGDSRAALNVLKGGTDSSAGLRPELHAVVTEARSWHQRLTGLSNKFKHEDLLLPCTTALERRYAEVMEAPAASVLELLPLPLSQDGSSSWWPVLERAHRQCRELLVQLRSPTPTTHA